MEDQSKLSIQTPWYEYHSKIVNLLQDDPELCIDKDLTIVDDSNIFEFKISSDNKESSMLLKNFR